MRQILQESDGIDHQKGNILNGKEAGRGIERRKERILHENIGSRHRVEERGFPRIRVTDKGNGEHLVFFSAFGEQRAALLHLFQFALKRMNARTDVSAIGLELSLAGPSRADAASETRERFALATKSRVEVFELGELDLNFTFTTLGTQRKDIENERRAVNDLSAIECRRKIERLRRGEFPVEEDGDIESLKHLADLLGLAFANIRRGIDLADFLVDCARIVCIGAFDESNGLLLKDAIVFTFDWLYYKNAFFRLIHVLSFLVFLRWTALATDFLWSSVMAA